MFAGFRSPNNLSKKMMRVVLSIYLAVTFFVTSMQFLTEYLKTQNAILDELQQLEQTVHGSIARSIWQYNQTQLEALVAGLIKMPIIEGVELLDKDNKAMIDARSYLTSSVPLSTFSTQSDIHWSLNNSQIYLGSITLYSSSQVVLDRVLFGFALIAVTAIFKLSLLFWLFVWAFNRYLATPLSELMLQVQDVQLSQDSTKRIHLSHTEDNELMQLQQHINNMLCSMARDRERLLEDEQAKRSWLEQAVAKRTEALQISNEKLKELASKDSLTQVLNRGSFFEMAQQLLSLAQRQKSTVSFILMDLDLFKEVNDTFGHFAGDKVLIHCTQTIQSLLRKSDLVARVGGEEFAVFLPDTGLDDAYRIANTIRQTIADSTLEIDNKTIAYTLSIGVVCSEPDDELIDELFKRVDLKLYGAKDKGRDRVEK